MVDFSPIHTYTEYSINFNKVINVRVVTKQEFLQLIDKHLPDDAQISATSTCIGDTFEIDQSIIETLMPKLTDIIKDGGYEEILPDATHVLYIP